MLSRLLTFVMRRSAVLAVLFIAAYSLAGNISAVSAELYIRKVKNGIIYYHFSDRGGQQKIAYPTHLAKPRINRPPSLQRLPSQNLHQLIQQASSSQNLPPALVKAVIKVESNFNPAATSPKGAQGLMQLMPETAQQLGVSNSYSIAENIWGGTRYLGQLLQKFNQRLP